MSTQETDDKSLTKHIQEVMTQVIIDRELAKIIRQYFKSGNEVPVERATIKRVDIERLL
jgi:hypothetical protein